MRSCQRVYASSLFFFSLFLLLLCCVAHGHSHCLSLHSSHPPTPHHTTPHHTARPSGGTVPRAATNHSRNAERFRRHRALPHRHRQDPRVRHPRCQQACQRRPRRRWLCQHTARRQAKQPPQQQPWSSWRATFGVGDGADSGVGPAGGP